MAKILVVDDEDDTRMITRILLQKAGHEVIEAASGDEGLKALEDYKPDLVILDVMMPGTTGWEVCEKIKTDSAVRDIPVLMFTVRTEMHDMRHSRKTGADAHVNKPFGMDVLLRTVERLLERESSEQE